MFPFWQLLNNLMGKARGDPKKLIGHIHDESQFDTCKYPTILIWSHFYRMLLCYILCDYDRAYDEAEGCQVLITHPFGSGDLSV